MKTIGKTIRSFRVWLGTLILPENKDGLVYEKETKISSHSADGEIAVEHHRKFHMRLFELSRDHVITGFNGIKFGNIYETTIYYTNKKLIRSHDKKKSNTLKVASHATRNPI